MAGEAGIYEALWRPDERGFKHAIQLIPILEIGLHLLLTQQARFEAFNAHIGWGLYEHFVPFVSNYLDACKKYPNAEVRVSR